MVDFSKKNNVDKNGQMIFRSKRAVNLPTISVRGGGVFNILILGEPVPANDDGGDTKPGKRKGSFVEVITLDGGKHGVFPLHVSSHENLMRSYPSLKGLAFRFDIPAEKTPGKDYKVPMIEEIDLDGHEEYVNDLLSKIVPPTTLAALRGMKS